VIVFRVSETGQLSKAATFERAGVPTLARLKDGRLIAAHQHFPENDPANFDKVAVRFSSDEGKTWTAPHVINLNGLPESMRFPFDPTLVPLPDGRIRMYFTSLHGRRFDEDTPGIYSAISTNGIDYDIEPGLRFGIPNCMVIDCAVVLLQNTFHLFSPDNGRARQPGQPQNEGPASPGVGYHAISQDGLQFTRVEDVHMEGGRKWLGNAQSDGDVMIFFGTGGRTGKPGTRQTPGGGWVATSQDGQTWRLLETPPIPGPDPGAVQTSDGGWAIIVNGPPRPGTPTAQQRGLRGR
jgi:hypothetical protein